MWLLFALILPSLTLLWGDFKIPKSWILLVVFASNFFSYLLMYWDKLQAQRRGWRISESTLHLLEALGGWPASRLAQLHLRHKTLKTRYQVVYALIVLTYQILCSIYLVLHWQGAL